MTPDDLSWPADGLIPVAVCDARSNALLTLAYANREALQRSIATRETHLWSRSRQALWRKGETSGNVQRIVEIVADCDGDALTYRVIPAGPACHTGAASCFEDVVLPASQGETAGAFVRAMTHLTQTIEARRNADPANSYVAKLLAEGVDRIAKKIGEEATEVVIAAKNADRRELVWETADLFFHTLVLLAERGVSLDEVGIEFERRAK